MQFGRCFFVKNAEWVRKKRRNDPPQQVVGKVCFYKNRANPLSLTPNPFLVVKGCVCLVGFASCKALVHTRPASVPGLSVGLPPQTKQGCLQSAAQSHCTMRWHKWLTTCTGATPLRPHFQKTQRFIDSLKYAPQNEVRIVLYSLLHCRFQALQCFFFTEQLHYGIQVGGIFSAGYRYSEYSASIGNRAFVSVGVCLVFLDVGAEA